MKKMTPRILGFGLVSYLILLMFVNSVFASTPAPAQAGAVNRNPQFLNQLPSVNIPFIKNEGQVAEEVNFYARTFGGTVFVTKKGEVAYVLTGISEETSRDGKTSSDAESDVWALRETLFGAGKIEATGMNRSATRANFFIGRDPNKWRTNIATYNSLSLGRIYEGIDLVLRAYGNNVEKVFTVHPGGRVDTIRLKIDGASSLHVNPEGELEIQTGIGPLRFSTPVAFQDIDGERKSIEVAYDVKGSAYGFQVGNYDHDYPLIIDPFISYATYLGGGLEDGGYAIDVDGSGNAYVCGWTASDDYPVTNGAFQVDYGGGSEDAFVARLDSSGSTFTYVTYLGGVDRDWATDITVGDAGNAYITGFTSSDNFPTTAGVHDEEFNTSGEPDAFVTKLAPNGNVDYSTYLGGNGDDRGAAIDIDATGSVYVAGYSQGGGMEQFPTTSGVYMQSHPNANYNAGFVTKIDSLGETLTYSTFFGGTGINETMIHGLTVDDTGNAYITGSNWYYDTDDTFPTSAGAIQADHIGGSIRSGFVTKFNSDGSNFIYSTLLGGSSSDWGQRIAIDTDGNAYVTGRTASDDFPLQTAYQGVFGGGFDAFVSKINIDGTALLYSTYLGGSDSDFGYGIAVDDSSRAVVTGRTSSSNYPTANAIADTLAGSEDAYVTQLSEDGSALVFSSYLGGSGAVGYDLALDASGNAYITGQTDGTGFPLKDPAQTTFGGGTQDAFLAKIAGVGRTWTQVNADGFGDANNTGVQNMVVFNNRLYVATSNSTMGCGVWEYDGTNWTQVNIDGFGDANNWHAVGMAVHNNLLYVGTANFTDGAEVWEYDGADWVQVNADGFGNASTQRVYVFEEYNGRLYAGTTALGGGEVWEYFGGTNWVQINTDGFGDSTNTSVESMAVYNGFLYVGTDQAEVWQYDYLLQEWSRVNTDGFGDTYNWDIYGLAVFNNRLYAGTYNPTYFGGTGGEVWEYNGETWIQANVDGFGDGNNENAFLSVVFNNRLYAGTGNDDTGGEMWEYDGAQWRQGVDAGFNDVNNQNIWHMVEFNGDLYAATFNDTSGAEVWAYTFETPLTNDITYYGDKGKAYAHWGVLQGDTYVDFESLAPGTQLTDQLSASHGVEFRSIEDYNGNPIDNYVLVHDTHGYNEIMGSPFPGASIDGRVIYEIRFTTPRKRAAVERHWNAYETITQFYNSNDDLLYQYQNLGKDGAFSFYTFGYEVDSADSADWIQRIVLTGIGTPSNRQVGNVLSVSHGSSTIPAAITAGTYYVNPLNGLDSNDGSSLASAWQTLHYALNRINFGELGSYTLILSPGLYSIENNSEDDFDLGIFQENLVIQGDTGGGSIIDGTGVTDWIHGLMIYADNVAVRNVTIENFPNVGVYVNSSSPTVEANIIRDCNSQGIFIYGFYSDASPEIFNNLIYNAGSGMNHGIGVAAFDQTAAPVIYHNTIDQVAICGINTYSSSADTPEPAWVSPDIRFNNITNSGEYGIYNGVYDAGDRPADPVTDYNNVWNNGASATDNYSAVTAGSEDISEDPLYVGNGNYQLQGASSSIDAIPDGLGGTVTEDIEGTERPQGAGNDIGCYESAGTSVTQYTLAVTSVGDGSISASPAVATGEAYNAGTEVTLTANPAEGWVFSAWSGDLTGSENPDTIIMDADKTVVATFVEKTYPDPPLAENPAHEAWINDGSDVTLETSTYHDSDGDDHDRSHWHVWRADTGEYESGYPFSTPTDLESHDIATTLVEGLKYNWQVQYQDIDGNLTVSQVYSFKIGTSVDESLPPVAAGQEVGDFGMISIVHWPDDPSPTAVFNIDYDPANYRIGTYNAMTGDYIEFGEGLEMEPGRAYWILAREGLTVNFNGVPVSETADVYVELDYNENTENGWNMVAPPNNFRYYWRNVQVVVDEGGTLTPIGTLQYLQEQEDQQGEPNDYIDLRLWRWNQQTETYDADTPETDPNAEMQAYAGYWVRAKQANIYLMFEEQARVIASLGRPENMLARTWHRSKTWLRNLDFFSREAIADSDSPPMPPAALDENTADPVFGGCYVKTIRE